MYWGAISTDIKKSSVNWNNAPDWMKWAVQFHNTIIIQTVKYWKDKKIVEIVKLPNSPEGDAFTFLFKHDNLDILRHYVTQIAHDIQFMLDWNRKDGGNRLNLDCSNFEVVKEEARDDFRTKEYYGGIYVRIGMAFSDEAPMSYEYMRYYGNRSNRRVKTKSYRGGVIYMSEEAEKRADYDLMPVASTEGTEDKGSVRIMPSIKECYFKLDDEGNPTDKLKFRDVREIPKLPSEKTKCTLQDVTTSQGTTTGRRSSLTRQKSKKEIQKLPNNNLLRNAKKYVKERKKSKIDKDEGGRWIFKKTSNAKNAIDTSMDNINYISNRASLEELCKKQPERVIILSKIYKALEEVNPDIKEIEGFAIFVQYHSVLNKDIIEHDLTNLKYIREEYNDLHKRADDVIKKILEEKRDNYSGGLIKQKRDDSSMYILEKDGSGGANDLPDIYKRMTKLLAFLPHNSSIGIAYGKMNKVTYTDELQDGGKYYNKYVDFFGDAVNLSARMEFKDFSYNTTWGVTASREHENRIAMTSDKFIEDTEEILEKDRMPFQIDYIPRKKLNVGSDGDVIVISTRIAGIPHFKIGDKVSLVRSDNKGKKGKIEDIYGDKIKLEKREKPIDIFNIKLKL